MTSRYTAHMDFADPSRVVLIDAKGENSRVVPFTAEQDDAIVTAAQAFLDAGTERFGSLDDFDRACRWYLDLEKAART